LVVCQRPRATWKNPKRAVARVRFLDTTKAATQKLRTALARGNRAKGVKS
jgi:hypothetical protein